MTDPISIFTGLLVLVTGGLVYVGWRQNQSTRTIERAYIKMSHVAPGLDITRPISVASDVQNLPPLPVNCMVQLQIENYGNTPGTVTEQVVNFKILEKNEPLPKEPAYVNDRKTPLQVFLVSGDKYFSVRRETLTLSVGDDAAIFKNGTKILYVYGYIDYIDKFGVRHRSGYARVFRHGRDDIVKYATIEEFNKRSNLDFVLQAGYDYDRKRKKGEGDDWNLT